MSQGGINNIPSSGTTSYSTNSGTATPSGGVLNIDGGTGISTTGSGNTVTINALSSVPLLFTANSGTATPSTNNLNVVGGTGITTSGSGSTLTISSSSGILKTTSILTSGNIKSLGASVFTLVAAAGVGTTIMFISAQLKFTYGGSNAFTNPQNLVLRYQGTTGSIVSSTIVGTGFIDQTSNQYQQAIFIATPPIVSATNMENQFLCLHNVGTPITGNAANDNTLTVTTFYTILTQ